ncbi:hypothetical protein [Haliea sp.]|uniref:hypothetical protein n=1 Tax=Haliea sp. TaxID=1932666 RepID=UPI00257BA36A|nr:hypothetical protein [Haliea sp.]
MLTGGSPTMHPRIVNEITNFAHERGILVTIETEGSHYLETDYPINLLSISPKFSNSVPTLDAIKPQGGEVNQKFIDKHNKFRLNNDAIAKSIAYHSDYHIKPVIDKELKIWPEIKDWLNQMKIPKNKVWLMPAGDDIQALLESYGPVMDLANREGYNFTSRAHIMAFGTKREV